MVAGVLLASWTTWRAGLGLIADDISEESFVGIDLGARIQTPTRIAPFLGVGVFNGYSEEPPSFDESEGFDGWRTSIYPEAGVPTWLTSTIRVSGHTAYNVTTEGRDHDFWLMGITLSWLPQSSTGFSDAYDTWW